MCFHRYCGRWFQVSFKKYIKKLTFFLQIADEMEKERKIFQLQMCEVMLDDFF